MHVSCVYSIYLIATGHVQLKSWIMGKILVLNSAFNVNDFCVYIFVEMKTFTVIYDVSFGKEINQPTK